jgi:mono/diheme cytochrome c family protein
MRPRRLLEWLSLALAALAATAGGTWLLSAPRPAFTEADTPALDVAGEPERGRLVFAAGNCASCHASTGQQDRLRLGGGMALASPFGTFRVPNISPDPIDGIGRWRTIDLANALMSGVSPDGSHFYPALPYTSYAHMQVDDVRDLMAYIRSLPPVSGQAPPHEISFPFNIRRFVGLWKLFYLNQERLQTDASRSTAWNRGRYLAEALGHCAECHSSRNLFGAIRPETRFAGGQDPEGTGFVPNITPGRIGSWSSAQIAEVLTSGNTPMRDNVGSTMVDVVTNTAMLPQTDRDALAVYIKSLPARPTPRP